MRRACCSSTGAAPRASCSAGRAVSCPAASAARPSLVMHRDEGLLRCHYCDAQRAIPQICPSCGLGPIAPYGIGTQRVAAEVEALFPAARIVRMDADTTTRIGDHARLLERFGREADVLIGTQMVAKASTFRKSRWSVRSRPISICTSRIIAPRSARSTWSCKCAGAAAARARVRRSSRRTAPRTRRSSLRHGTTTTASRIRNSPSGARSGGRRSCDWCSPA